MINWNFSPKNCKIYPNSHQELNGVVYELFREDGGEKILKITGCNDQFVDPIEKAVDTAWYPCNSENLAVLKKCLPWLKPSLGGLVLSAGTGDRLGLATPGHVRAFENRSIFPVFAQQSVRENNRTNRSTFQVMDDAVWGIFQEGWRGKWGADADHLKTIEEANAFIDAGFTYYTIDASEFVQDVSHVNDVEELESFLSRINFRDLETEWHTILTNYCDKEFNLGSYQIQFDLLDLSRIVAKYGNLLAQVVAMVRHIKSHTTECEFEVSVDETDETTSPEEHFFIINEFHRLGINIIGLAPKFIGRFEKGVDYIGDLGKFEESLEQHAAVVDAFSDYKISLHSGSDKFSIYPLLKKHLNKKLHLKTSGTSYLEAMRLAARLQPDTFYSMLKESIAVYPTESRTYHVSADIDQIPNLYKPFTGSLEFLLDNFHVREVLHVGYGAVLSKYFDEMKSLLIEYESLYHQGIETHFNHHFDLIAGTR